MSVRFFLGKVKMENVRDINLPLLFMIQVAGLLQSKEMNVSHAAHRFTIHLFQQQLSLQKHSINTKYFIMAQLLCKVKCIKILCLYRHRWIMYLWSKTFLFSLLKWHLVRQISMEYLDLTQELLAMHNLISKLYMLKVKFRRKQSVFGSTPIKKIQRLHK